MENEEINKSEVIFSYVSRKEWMETVKNSSEIPGKLMAIALFIIAIPLVFMCMGLRINDLGAEIICHFCLFMILTLISNVIYILFKKD